jgi:hypothetical protein
MKKVKDAQPKAPIIAQPDVAIRKFVVQDPRVEVPIIPSVPIVAQHDIAVRKFTVVSFYFYYLEEVFSF